MYINTKIKILTGFFLALFSVIALANQAYAGSKIVYPLKEISKLECRFQDFKDLGSNCKQSLPVLNTKDYQKYAKQNGGYNEFTRIYTVLWGSSYKYGWDVGYGGHQGTDIATAKGTPVYSMADGTVIVSKTDAAWGKVVSVKHNINGKTIVSDYAHLSKIDVKNGTKVKAGQKIGEVGSTGNSTGNHLHFQIDFESKFYPYYYDYNACPYSYYKITEQGVCFDELERHTIDPMLFLETNGAALDDIEITTTKVSTSSSSSSSSSSKDGDHDPTIFSRTVHIGYPVSDVQEVQMLFTDLREYNGPISGDYTDIEQDIIDYQIVNKLIKDKNDYGAGWFGPKTREQAQNDYKNFLANGGKRKVKLTDTGTTTTVATKKTKTQKISKEGLLSREEIEAREVAEFIKDYNLDLKFADATGRVALGETKILKLTITNSRGRPFKGNLPGNITFKFDDKKIKVFPNKFYYFSDGKRDIKVTGLTKGTTSLEVKFGAQTLKKVFINVTSQGEEIVAKAGTIISHTKSVIGEEKSGVILFKDAYGQKLIQTPYKGSFTLKAVGNAEICIKSGSIQEVKQVYRRGCSEEEYKKEITFGYNDTVAGLAMYSYRVFDTDAKIELRPVGSSSILSYKNIKTTAPKGLATSHEYYDDVMTALETGIASDINQGYFLQDRAITQRDANQWIKNTLYSLQDETLSPDMKKRISQNIATIDTERSTSEYLTRKEFLDKSYKYLALNTQSSTELSRKYRDLEDDENRKANVFFDENYTWKDQFGEDYYRPGVQITRGEAAFLLARASEKNKEVFLTLR